MAMTGMASGAGPRDDASAGGDGGYDDRADGANYREPWEDDAELAFTDEDERLPWLESDDEDDSAAGIDTGRIVTFAVLGLVALLAIIGSVWWLTNRDSDGAQIADGSIIEAPDEPYKVKPEDEGGKEFEGTGDTSFAVGEGKTREGRLAETPAIGSGPLTKPVPDAAQPNASRPAETTSAPSIETVKPDAEAIAQANDGVGVQVGAYSTKASAEAGWRTLQGQTEALNGVRHRIVRGRADIGIVYRLQAIAGSGAAADALCGALRDDGLDCQVKR